MGKRGRGSKGKNRKERKRGDGRGRRGGVFFSRSGISMMGERGIGLNRGLLVHFAFRALSSDATVI